jgi:uncharacterized protein
VTGKKVYIIDPGMRNRVSFRFSEDAGRILENIIFLELHRRSDEVCYYREQGECDFVTLDKGSVSGLYLVCRELNEWNRERGDLRD